MPRIGSVDFDIIRGTVPEPRQVLETWTRLGFDGIGARKTGKRTGTFQLVGIKYLSLGGLASFKKSIANNAEEIISIRDDFANSADGCLILNVSQVRAKQVEHRGFKKIRVEVTITLTRS